MIIGNAPPTRWRTLVAGTLAAGLAACDNNSPSPAPADAAADALIDATDAPPTDTPSADTTPPDDTQPQTDASSDTPSDTPADTPTITMATRAVVDCGTVCVRPLDAVPNAAGTVVFFTAFTPAGEAAVFRANVPSAGSAPATPMMITSGGGLEFPLGITISNDDMTLYIADQSADRGTETDVGAVFSVAASGGTATSINVGTELVRPAAISMSVDGNDLLISGQRRTDTDLTRALYRVPRAGGAATLLTTDLVDPSGVSQAPGGAIIVHDTRRGGARSATAVVVGASSVSDLAGGLVAGYPAGLSYAMDSRSALFSGADPSVGDGLLTFAGPDGRPTAPASLSSGMSTPLGLHRARSGDTWAVADETANGAGQVFLITSR